MRENKTVPSQEWLEMSTAQLDAILQQELQAEHPKEEVVLGILRILQDREADCPVEVSAEVGTAWKTYKEKAVPPKKTCHRRTWFVSVAAAAIICIVIMAIPRTVGAESIFDAFFRWTESVFEFFTPGQEKPKPSTEYVFQTNNPGLQQVHDEIAALGVTEPVVPMWVPEGYELIELKNTPMPSGNKVYAILQLEDKAIILAYRTSVDIIASKHEKEETAVEAYESSDVCHFIMDNDQNISVTWTIDGAECSISANLGMDEVYKLIDSIYRRELS